MDLLPKTSEDANEELDGIAPEPSGLGTPVEDEAKEPLAATPPLEDALPDPEVPEPPLPEPSVSESSLTEPVSPDEEPAPSSEVAEAPEAPETDGPEESEEASEETPRFGPGEDLSDEELAEEITALLFASAEPLRIPRLSELLGRPNPRRVRATLEELGERLRESGLPIVVRSIAGGWRMLTDPGMGEVVSRLQKERRPERISGAALETLAIVAYRQPVTKAEVEAIRGVQAGPMLRSLVDRRLVRVTGRAEVPGSPLLYGTTREFLERFGIDRLADLPRDGELVQD